MPGYLIDDSEQILESDYAGRELREIAFNENLKISRFNAFDYFENRFFYLLDSPGHAIDHICDFIKVFLSPSLFILISGDICHYVKQFCLLL